MSARSSFPTTIGPESCSPTPPAATPSATASSPGDGRSWRPRMIRPIARRSSSPRPASRSPSSPTSARSRRRMAERGAQGRPAHRDGRSDRRLARRLARLACARRQALVGRDGRTRRSYRLRSHRHDAAAGRRACISSRNRAASSPTTRTLQAFLPGVSAQDERSAGACRGVFELAEALADGAAAGAAAAGAPAPAPIAVEGAPAAHGGVLGLVAPSRGDQPAKAFVDFQNDVTARDVKLATREGMRSIEHIKRYTTTGMATDQGKTSNMNALAIAAEALGKPIAGGRPHDLPPALYAGDLRHLRRPCRGASCSIRSARRRCMAGPWSRARRSRRPASGSAPPISSAPGEDVARRGRARVPGHARARPASWTPRRSARSRSSAPTPPNSSTGSTSIPSPSSASAAAATA